MPDKRTYNDAGRRFLDDNSIPSERREILIKQANQLRKSGGEFEGKGLFYTIGRVIIGFVNLFSIKDSDGKNDAE